MTHDDVVLWDTLVLVSRELEHIQPKLEKPIGLPGTIHTEIGRIVDASNNLTALAGRLSEAVKAYQAAVERGTNDEEVGWGWLSQSPAPGQG